MSFKSKQRAKHGHLFGDDPLNASSTTTSSPDPLSRSSSPSDSPNGSIFGGIDVSKFNNKQRTVRTNTRSPMTDDDSDFLFGGSSSSRKTVKEPAKKQPPPPPPPRQRPVSLLSNASPRTSLSSASSSPSIPSSPVLTKTASPVPPPPPPRTHKKHQQQSPQEPQQQAVKQIDIATERKVEDRFMQHQQQQPVKRLSSSSNATIEPKDEDRLLQLQKAAMMEDEATRAFAAHDLTASSSTPTVKTPAASSTNNPWDAPSPMATTTTPLPTQLDKRLGEIEPAKRAAFADLIANWHGARKNNDPIIDDDDDTFLTSVACEQRDVGFAGIDNSTSKLASFAWQQDDLLDENPWSS